MKPKYNRKDPSPKREWENVAISNEYIDSYIQKYSSDPAKLIKRSTSMRNDKSQKKVGTAINWMPKEVVKEQEAALPQQQVRNIKQMYGTSSNWKPEFRSKASNLNRRDKSLKTKYGQFGGRRVNYSFLPDINQKRIKNYIFNTRAKASPPKKINKTFANRNNYCTYKEEEIDENETAFEDSGIGYRITRKNSNLCQPFAEKFVGKLNLMLYDFNGCHKKPRQVNKYNSPSNTNQICQKTLSCFNTHNKGVFKRKTENPDGSPKQGSIDEEYINNHKALMDRPTKLHTRLQNNICIKRKKDSSNNSLLKWSKCDNEIDEKLSEESN
jgi:hypothetical protein